MRIWQDAVTCPLLPWACLGFRGLPGFPSNWIRARLSPEAFRLAPPSDSGKGQGTETVVDPVRDVDPNAAFSLLCRRRRL